MWIIYIMWCTDSVWDKERRKPVGSWTSGEKFWIKIEKKSKFQLDQQRNIWHKETLFVWVNFYTKSGMIMTSGHWPSSFKVNTFVRWFAKSPRWVSKSPWHTDWTKKSHLVRLRRCLRYWNVWDNENELWVTAKTANRWCSMWEKVKQFSKVVDQLTRSMSDSSSLSDVSFGEVCPKSQISNLGPKSQISGSNLKS